jgi:hypothetical protein
MRYHGNYCGPGWSAGKYQNSVVSDVPATDEFDETCRQHDAAYARGQSLKDADYKFAYDNLTSFNPKRMVAGALVGAQGLFRPIDRSPIPLTNYQSINMPNLRGNNSNYNNKQTRTKGIPSKGAAPKRSMPSKTMAPFATELMAPATVGTAYRSQRIKRKQTATGVIVNTNVFSGKCTSSPATGSISIVHSFVVTPSGMGNAEFASLAQLYEMWRVRAIRFNFHPQASTSTTGDAILIYAREVGDQIPNGDSTNFYSRAISGRDALITPVWCAASLVPEDLDTEWKMCDSLACSALKEFAAGAFYVLVNGTTVAPGFISMDVEIEFENMKYNPRNIISGSYLGPSTGFTATLVAAVNAANTPAQLAGSGFTPGDIYLVTFDSTSVSYPTGTTSTTLFAVSNSSSGTSTPLTFHTNLTLYARAFTTTNLQLYYTFSNGVEGSNAINESDIILYGAATTSVGSLANTRVLQLRNSSIPIN